MKKSILIISFLFISIFSYGQNSDWGAWFGYFGNKKINDNWNVVQVIQYRKIEIYEGKHQFLGRLGIAYKFSENNKASFGVDFLPNFQYHSIFNRYTNFYEFRIYQSYTNQFSILDFSFQNRIRLEEVFMYANFRKVRLRYAFTIKYNINSSFYLKALDELFLHSHS